MARHLLDRHAVIVPLRARLVGVKLFGYSTSRPALGIVGQFVPLGELTVLLGANDAGKSTLLSAFDEDLRGGPSPPVGDELASGSGALFVEVDNAQLERLLSGSVKDEGRFSASWTLGGYDDDALDQIGTASGPGSTPADWIDHLRHASESPPSFERVLAALRDSRLVCFETEQSRHEGTRRTAAYWCLPPLGELDNDVVAALQESQLRLFLPKGPLSASKGVRRLRFGGDSHLEVAGAPIAIAPIGWQPDFAAPIPLRAPAGFGAVRAALADAVTRVVVAVRHSGADAVESTHWDSREVESRKAPGVWLTKSEDDRWEVDPTALWALARLAHEAERFLVPFASERYQLVVRMRPVSEWFGTDPIALELSPRPAEKRRDPFDVEHVAEGLELWVQLALVGAAQELERLAGRIAKLGADAAYEEFEARREESGDRPESPHQAAWAETVGRISSGQSPETLPAILREAESEADALRRVVIVDEPERHLNPRLQRQAASWLQALVERSGTPCLAASHSVAFLSLPRPAVFAHVRRDGPRVEVERLDPSTLDALDEAAADLGFVRGELLSTVGCFLLVEGVHDQIVIDRIFERELRDAGVYVIPIRGGGRKTLFDADALWRFTTAPAALAVDNIDPNVLAAAQAGDVNALATLTRAGSSEESKAAGVLLAHAQGKGRELHLLAHPGMDLIDTLDDAAVIAVYSRYPGVGKMQDAWEAHVRAAAAEGTTVSAGTRKTWLQAEYGIDNSRDAYTKIADAHVRLGRRPPHLEQIVTRAVELATEARATI
jgi:hypothetical protein